MPKLETVVTDDEKQNVKDKAAELELTESELVRTALQKMGVKIEIKKAEGARPGNNNRRVKK